MTVKNSSITELFLVYNSLMPYYSVRRQTRDFKKRTEENLQIKVCNYIRRNYPGIFFVGDYAAGLKLTDWQRIQMMKMRSDDGHPDISIDYPSRGYHGMRLELKAAGTAIYKKDGSLRKQPYVRRYKNGMIKRGDHLAEQAATLKKYNDIGYFSRFGVGYEATVQLIDWYMGQDSLDVF